MGSEKRILYYKEIIGSCKMNHHKPYEWLVFIQAKCFYVYVGIGRDYSNMSFFQRTKHLIKTSTAFE